MPETLKDSSAPIVQEKQSKLDKPLEVSVDGAPVKVSKCPFHRAMRYLSSFDLTTYFSYFMLAVAIHLPLVYGGAAANPLKTGNGCPVTPMMMYGFASFFMVAFALYF